ncbi:arylsulfatase [Aurantiacibacter xanthus]|nr:arylsulfatase [Aurantiacibacter xanthus]
MTAIAVAAAALASPASYAQNQSAQEPPVAENGQWQHYPARPEAPEGAPNILVVMTDDVGYSAAASFGGPVAMPNFDRLAREGLQYTQLHTTAMCSPSRAALLTGRNHHAVGNGSISNVSIDAPGYTSVIPKSAATLGRVLRDNGYDTGFFGKNHNTPDWDLGPMGSFENWPIGWGFNYFYGFNAAGTDQFNPPLLENINFVRRDPNDEDYIFDRDLVDHMLGWLSAQHGTAPDKPFFMYYAPGTVHGPQQAPREWIDKFAGQFDMGWDELQRQIFARQKEMGLIPQTAQMPEMTEDVPRWNTLTSDQKRLYARMMEVAAGQLAFMDYQFGRVLDRLKEIGELDNTLIIYVQGDNGAALHDLHGSTNTYSQFAGVVMTEEEMLAQFDELGGEDTFGDYPVGWGLALNTPFPWGKTVASKLGGQLDGMVVSWPDRITDGGTLRTQFTHVIDIAPTIYEAIGITPPEEVDGVAQQPIDGISFAYTFDDADAPARHREQYFEMLGSRAYYKDGWLASTSVNWKPWEANKTDPYQTPWELYNLNEDYTQVRDVSSQYPEKLEELQLDFDSAAERYNIYPLSADFFGRIDPKYRPTGVQQGASHTYYPSDFRYPARAFPIMTNTWQADAEITVGGQGDSGPIAVQGGKFSGWALSLEDGFPQFIYNPSGRAQERRILRSPVALPAGTHRIAVGFTPQAQGVLLSMTVDGEQVDEVVIDRVVGSLAGEALIGRPQVDDRNGPRRCDCTVGPVTFTN